jgi:tetratricopeptide (TPR) repeat protein
MHRRPFLIGALVTVLAVAVAVAWTAATRDREYGRLIAAGDAALAGGETTLAIEAFSGAIALKRDAMLAHLRRGETYRRRGDLTAALRDLRTAVQLDRTATRPLEQLGDVYYALQHYERAADRYAAFVQVDDRSPRLLYKLALARYRAGDAAGAVTPLREAIQQNDAFAEAYYLLGVSLGQQAETSEALWALQRAATLAPSLTATREALAALLHRLGRHRERLVQLEALADLEPDRPARLLAVGAAHAEAGRMDAAVQVFGRAIDRQPGDEAAYAAVASAWLRLAETRGDSAALEKALEATRAALARGAASGDTLALHGRALLLAGDTERALAVLRSAAARLPVQPIVFERLATAAERAGSIAEARDALARYVTLVDDQKAHIAAAHRLAAWSTRLGQPADAARWLERLWQLAPADEALAVRLVEAQIASGALDRARQALLRARERGLDSPALRRLESRLP